MDDEADDINRRSFFPTLAFSPLALLGLRKKPDKTDLRVKRMYETKEYYRKRFNDLIERLQTADEDADYWRLRCLAAELDLKDRNDSIDMGVHLLKSGRDKIDASEFLSLERGMPYRHSHCMTRSAEKKLEQVEDSPLRAKLVRRAD